MLIASASRGFASTEKPQRPRNSRNPEPTDLLDVQHSRTLAVLSDLSPFLFASRRTSEPSSLVHSMSGDCGEQVRSILERVEIGITSRFFPQMLT